MKQIIKDYLYLELAIIAIAIIIGIAIFPLIFIIWHGYVQDIAVKNLCSSISRIEELAKTSSFLMKMIYI